MIFAYGCVMETALLYHPCQSANLAFVLLSEVQCDPSEELVTAKSSNIRFSDSSKISIQYLFSGTREMVEK